MRVGWTQSRDSTGERSAGSSRKRDDARHQDGTPVLEPEGPDAYGWA
jgi:hypothetical protein